MRVKLAARHWLKGSPLLESNCPDWSILRPQLPLQAAANLYIPRIAEADEGANLGNGRAKGVPLSTAASGADDKSSPFEGLQIVGAEQKPIQAPEKPAQGEKVRAAFSVWQQEQLGSA